MSEDALKLTPQQASDTEAASLPIYAEAADEVFDGRTLSADMVALAALFFVAVTYHLQNPLLMFGTPFGNAFRNTTLQPVTVIALIVFAISLTMPYLRSTPSFAQSRNAHQSANSVEWVAIAVLAVYCLFVLLAIVLRFNVSGAVAGVTQDVFTARLTETTPTADLQRALDLVTPFAYAALVAVVILWHPWTRLAVYQRAIRKQGAALLVGAVVLIGWELLINVFQIQEFLLPRPTVIGAAFSEVYPRLVSAGWVTFQNAFWGFVIGCGAGILTGMVASRFVSFSRALLPVAVGINAVPIIALAPLMNNWFGALNPASKIGIVAVLTYFPAMVSTVRGLTSVDVVSLELMKTYAASQQAIFLKLRLPSALPFIFSALKVSTTLAMIGAIVSEYFGGSTAGLGFRIRDDAGLFRYPDAWSAILISALYGILFYLAVSGVERALMSWHVSFREN